MNSPLSTRPLFQQATGLFSLDDHANVIAACVGEKASHLFLEVGDKVLRAAFVDGEVVVSPSSEDDMVQALGGEMAVTLLADAQLGGIWAAHHTLYVLFDGGVLKAEADEASGLLDVSYC